MPYFKSQEEMFDVFRSFFEAVASNPAIGPDFQKSKLIVRFQVHDPDGLMTINCRDVAPAGKYFSFTLGETGVKPDLTLTSSADFNHEFWLGKANVISALFGGKVCADGDIALAAKIVPFLKPVFDLYPRVLRQLGREDLIIS